MQRNKNSKAAKQAYGPTGSKTKANKNKGFSNFYTRGTLKQTLPPKPGP